MHTEPAYNARLIKGGALIGDIRQLVRSWQGGQTARDQKEAGVRANLLAKASRGRAADIYQHAFLPRFVAGPIPDAWRLARALEDRDLPLDILRPVYYWITARSEPIIYDFASQVLWPRARSGETALPVREVVTWLQRQVSEQRRSWSHSVVVRVAQGLLSALRDFGLIEGRSRKRLAPAHVSIEAFAYLAFLLHHLGASGERLVEHPDWRLFLLPPSAVEHLFVEAHQRRLLTYHAAGRIVRIEFPARTAEDMADVIAARAH